MVTMTRMKIGSIILFCGFISPQNLYFTVSDLNENANLANLKISAEANKLIRDNAYLSFFKNVEMFEGNNYSVCWLDFIKNRKIQIKTSENNISFVKRVKNKYTYKVYFDPNKIKIMNVNKNDFLSYCKKAKTWNHKNGGGGGN